MTHVDPGDVMQPTPSERYVRVKAKDLQALADKLHALYVVKPTLLVAEIGEALEALAESSDPA